jgi:hypothetical protein
MKNHSHKEKYQYSVKGRTSTPLMTLFYGKYIPLKFYSFIYLIN